MSERLTRRGFLVLPIYAILEPREQVSIVQVSGSPTVYQSALARRNGLYRCGFHRRDPRVYTNEEVLSDINGFTSQDDFLNYSLARGQRLVENHQLFEILRERRPNDWMSIAKGFILGGEVMPNFCAPEIGMLGYSRSEDPLNYIWREVVCMSSSAYDSSSKQFQSVSPQMVPMCIADLLGHSRSLQTHFADMPPATIERLYPGISVREETPYFQDGGGAPIQGRLPQITMTFDRAQLQ